MLSVERQREVYELLRQRGSARVADIARHLDVSLQTVRRDLDTLEAEGLVRRVHGGAVVPADEDVRLALPAEPDPGRRDVHRRMAAAAAERLHAGATVFLSGGPLAEHVVPWLGGLERLTVITNAVAIAHLLMGEPRVHAIVVGGTLRHPEGTLLGQLAEQAMGRFHLDDALLADRGLDAEEGLFATSVAEAALDRQVIEVADRLTVLADGPLLTRRGPVRVAAVERVTTVITDDAAPAGAVRGLRERGVEVELA